MQRLFVFGLFESPRPEDEILDRPISNFDVIGVPSGGDWSSSLLACHENIIPSCIMSFCCPCILWAQIVVRAQIPYFIALKNGFPCLRNISGYGYFVDYFIWSLIITAVLIVILISIPNLSFGIKGFIILLIILVFGTLWYNIAHTRSAFREK